MAWRAMLAQVSIEVTRMIALIRDITSRYKNQADAHV